MDTSKLNTAPRLLLTAQLKPVLGTRFQPTGFPDLGAATYKTADGKNMLLVESAQSMANRLEAVCWDESANDLVKELKEIPYVTSKLPDGSFTTSIQEAHRVNSPYIFASEGFSEIAQAIGYQKDKPFNRQKLIQALFKYDPFSIIHGIFLEKVGGVVRTPRVLTGFIEASEVTEAASGGVKIDRIQPGASKSEESAYGKSDEGYCNVIFHRSEFTGSIKVFFNVDLAMIHGFDLSADAKKLLLELCLFKIAKFLHSGLRLRTACDLELDGTPTVIAPKEFVLPSFDEASKAVRESIDKNKNGFKKLDVVYDKKFGKKKGKEKNKAADESNESDQ